jgi:hypothetical protein
MTSKVSEDFEATGERQRLLTKTEETKPEVEGTIYADVWDTITLGVPIFFSMLSWVGMKTTDSALLGHVSAKALSAAALSDLVRRGNASMRSDESLSHLDSFLVDHVFCSAHEWGRPQCIV